MAKQNTPTRPPQNPSPKTGAGPIRESGSQQGKGAPVAPKVVTKPPSK